MRINHPDWYPMYLNPDFGEILELAKSGWDTCRILYNESNSDIIIASGLGNTHNSMVIRYKEYLNKKRAPYCDSYILWRNRNQQCILNPEGDGQEPWGLDVLGKHEELIRDLIRESGYSVME